MSEDWYNEHWLERESEVEALGFATWFEEYYGRPDQHPSTECEQDEYWTRRGFALMGWIASSTHCHCGNKKPCSCTNGT